MSRMINTEQEPPKFTVFMHESKDNLACIRISEGKFKDIVFNFGVVSVGKFDADDPENVPLNYTYEIVEGEVADEDTTEFEDTTAAILVKLVTDFTDESDE